MNWFTQYIKTMCGHLTPLQAVAVELAEAELALLRAETNVEYSSALATYNKQRIKRLRAYITTESKKAS